MHDAIITGTSNIGLAAYDALCRAAWDPTEVMPWETINGRATTGAG